ncbi:ATP-binding cassette domain-containing protein [Actinopolymorpha singaporensis]|uniref:ABC-2 type transport system ATP-binding protein n=1 Tax=Actinopolymorpha singaporensis TaxID=117157 RepID=A0A1H1N910_9ACTN|nr:ATP-binding cassette domain-containing protein [Actinopolymorpha singaporensis]SDR95482.1 ABC-2 type transport system ATP-binding protein [Actinopolymorpha singaporensis]
MSVGPTGPSNGLPPGPYTGLPTGLSTASPTGLSTGAYDGSADTSAVCLRGVSYRFKEHLAVADVDLDVRRGEVFGLLGPNGAGKTTTIRLLTTLLPIQDGRVHVFGRDVRRSKMAVRRLLGYVPQQLSADADLTGRENVALFARLFDVPRRERRHRIDDALAVMGLSDAADRLASTYSGGMIRRLELAQALVSRPRLLVLDEPTIGLDPIARGTVWERVQELRADTGMTVLVTTHYMDEAEQECDRIALMHLGRLRAVGAPAELKAALGPGATLEAVFRHHSGDVFGDGSGEGEEGGDFRGVRSTRRTARRLG